MQKDAKALRGRTDAHRARLSTLLLRVQEDTQFALEAAHCLSDGMVDVALDDLHLSVRKLGDFLASEARGVDTE